MRWRYIVAWVSEPFQLCFFSNLKGFPCGVADHFSEILHMLDNHRGFIILLSSADFLTKIKFQENSSVNGLNQDVDQDRLSHDLRSVGPDPSPTCLQRLSADDKGKHGIH